eukprot:1037773-Alexandrium_andersonii.AAC.1
MEQPRAAYKTEMGKAWDAVAAAWQPEAILGPVGSQFVRAHAARTSNHELHVAMACLAALAPLTNGAGVSIFPGATSPLNAMMILVGYPQTRKSQMTKLAKDI